MRPAVANDGGDITFRGFKDGIVYLNMKGSCAGCPSSTATLQHGIQNCCAISCPTWSKCGRCETLRISGMVREHQTRESEKFSGAQLAPGSMLRIAPE